ncbi:MAG: Mov34/MPN/PAD-1 family protein [Archaeoglobus sp.]|nr:Mov34/MPN/PAD-1 family protein [Archaeoglobus sp.]
MLSSFLKRFGRETGASVIIGESEFLEFQKMAEKAGQREIVGALVGFESNGSFIVLNIFKYRGNSSASHVEYNQLESSFLPAGLENLGTIHTHPGFGAFLSPTDLENLRSKKLNKIAIVLDPTNMDLKAFDVNGKQIKLEIVEDYEIFQRIKIMTFFKYGIPFRVYLPNEDYDLNAKIKSHIDKRYGDSQLQGIYSLVTNDSLIYYMRPKLIVLKYRNKVPLYFPIKNSISLREWFNSFVLNGILDFSFRKCVILKNGKRMPIDVLEEVVKDGVTECHLY